MTDDATRYAGGSGGSFATTALDDASSTARPFVQITETTARQSDAAEALDRRDAYGRVPVVVRIRQRPPLRVELLAIAGVLVLAAVVLPTDAVFRVLFVVGALVAAVSGIASRAILRIPAGSVGLVMRGGRQHAVLRDGIHRVNPFLVLTHIVTTREIAFDVPVSEVRSADGIAVTIDLLLTLGISDPARMVYTVSTEDLDQLALAATQDAVRTLIRSVDALTVMDLGQAEADQLRATIDAKLEAYGVDVRGAAITRVALPSPLTASLEARRLATVQLAETEQTHALAQRRLADRAALAEQEASARHAAVAHDAEAEALRLRMLEERITANPHAARYDLERSRLEIARQLAGNSRAVVSLGGGDLVADLLVAREASPDGGATTAPAAPEAAVDTPAPVVAPEPDAAAATPPPAATRRRRAGRAEA